MSKPVVLHDATGIIMSVPGVGILEAYGTTVPTNGSSGYATGCIYHKTNGGANTSIYVNEGSSTSSSFVGK